jgi:hypothetical protein
MSDYIKSAKYLKAYVNFARCSEQYENLKEVVTAIDTVLKRNEELEIENGKLKVVSRDGL